MDVETVALIAAGLGVLFSLVWVVLGVLGVRSLQGMRRVMRQRGKAGDGETSNDNTESSH